MAYLSVPALLYGRMIKIWLKARQLSSDFMRKMNIPAHASLEILRLL